MKTDPKQLGGIFTLPGTPFSVHRMGYGAMQLAGPGVFGPPRDRAACLAVLREVIERGVNHIDTSDFYGPYVTNEIIREALHPYPENLTIVTKVGAVRGTDASWNPALRPEDLRKAVHDNLGRLGMDALHVVNLRVGGLAAPNDSSIAEPFGVLAEMQKEGLIQHLGLSNVSPAQLAEAQAIAPVVCIQNLYNVAHRADDTFIDTLNAEGIAFVPFFPLGGFSPLQSETLDTLAGALGITSRQLALAWLLQRAPNILLIPGTSSLPHLRENLAAADLTLPAEIVTKLDHVAKDAVKPTFGH